MSRPYRSAGRSVFGTSEGQVSLPKPLKRPTQERARSTAQRSTTALFKFVFAAVGRSVDARARRGDRLRNGALYEYFPNRDVLLSGYARHAVEARLELARERACIPDLEPEERVAQPVRAMLDVGGRAAVGTRVARASLTSGNAGVCSARSSMCGRAPSRPGR